MKRANGFTLIELLVVIVLIGIIATMGVLNLTNWLSEREAKQEVQVIRDQIRILMDDAVISQLTLALRIYPDYIKIYERIDDGWQESLRNQKGEITLSKGITLNLLNLDAPKQRLSQGEEQVGMIYLGSDGRVSPYWLRVEDSNYYCDLQGDIAGNIKMLDCQRNRQ